MWPSRAKSLTVLSNGRSSVVPLFPSAAAPVPPPFNTFKSEPTSRVPRRTASTESVPSALSFTVPVPVSLPTSTDTFVPCVFHVRPFSSKWPCSVIPSAPPKVAAFTASPSVTFIPLTWTVNEPDFSLRESTESFNGWPVSDTADKNDLPFSV